MSNIYLKVTIEKKWCTQNFNFKSLKSFSPGQFLESSNSCRYHWIFKILVAEVWEQNCVWLLYYFYFERNYDELKSKSLCFLLNKNINFNKNETGLKMENPITVLERWTMCFSLYKNCKLKIKLMSWSSQKKKRINFTKIKFILSIGHIFNIWVLFQFIVYLINFQNIYIYILQHMKEHYSIHFCCLFLKSLKAFSVSLPSF